MVASMLVGGIFTLICALFEEGGLRAGMAIMGERVTKIQGDSSARRLGFVDLDFECSTDCPIRPAWADGDLAGAAGS